LSILIADRTFVAGVVIDAAVDAASIKAILAAHAIDVAQAARVAAARIDCWRNPTIFGLGSGIARTRSHIRIGAERKTGVGQN
jgi:hypothetical protein